MMNDHEVMVLSGRGWARSASQLVVVVVKPAATDLSPTVAGPESGGLGGPSALTSELTNTALLLSAADARSPAPRAAGALLWIVP